MAIKAWPACHLRIRHPGVQNFRSRYVLVHKMVTEAVLIGGDASLSCFRSLQNPKQNPQPSMDAKYTFPHGCRQPWLRIN